MDTPSGSLLSVNTPEGCDVALSASPTLHGDLEPPAGHLAQVSPSPAEKPSPDGENTNVFKIDWDGPDDPGNPQSWSFKQKWSATVIVSGFTFITPVSSSMIAPATGQVAAQFGIHSSVVAALITSIFMLAYAIGPLCFGPLSEVYGRSRVLQLTNLWFLSWNIACAFAQNELQLLCFRFLAGLGGSAPLAIGCAVLADCWRAEERGRAASVFTIMPLVGFVAGPITGAWITERSTWRWVFWSTSIVDAVVQVLGLRYLQETYAPVLLQKRADKMRKLMDLEKTTYGEIRTIFDGKQDRSWRAFMATALVRPFVLFTQEPIIQLLGMYMAYLYGVLFLFLATIPSTFEGVYQQSVGIAGLHNFALGIGLVGASQLNMRTMDRVYAYLKDKHGGVGQPEFRLPAMFVGTLLLPIGLLTAGWTIQAHVHWIAPDIGIMFVGAGIILNFQCIQTYVIDAFTLHAASAIAAVSCLRSLAGFGFPLFASAMYASLGFGKGNSVLALVAVVIGCPAPWIFWHFGERIRNASRRTQSQ